MSNKRTVNAKITAVMDDAFYDADGNEHMCFISYHPGDDQDEDMIRFGTQPPSKEGETEMTLWLDADVLVDTLRFFGVIE